MSSLNLIEYALKFQSQTGSPSSSDEEARKDPVEFTKSFNPKREAHPLQTYIDFLGQDLTLQVSIPNGKPILFRLGYSKAGAISRLGFQSQTGSPSSSDSSAPPDP